MMAGGAMSQNAIAQSKFGSNPSYFMGLTQRFFSTTNSRSSVRMNAAANGLDAEESKEGAPVMSGKSTGSVSENF